MANWIVELEPGVFLAPISGDPGRTLDARNAKVFDSHPRARLALLAAQKMRPFEAARVKLAPMREMHDTAGISTKRSDCMAAIAAAALRA